MAISAGDPNSAIASRKRHRQGDPKRCAQDTRAQDVGGVLHFRRNQIQRRRGENKQVGERVDGDVEGQPFERIDVEQALVRAGQRHPNPIEPARIRTCEQDPADRPQVGWGNEGSQNQEPDDAFPRHVGSRNRPGDRHGKNHA
jgi:hypothetical protein